MAIRTIVVLAFIGSLGLSAAQKGYGYPPKQPYDDYVPTCAKNATEKFCLTDHEYPSTEVKRAIENNFNKFDELYADVLDQGTKDSVDRLTKLQEETYLCPSDTAYARPLRALNTEGKWRVIVNYADSYKKYTQTVRIERCRPTHEGGPCPKIPACYDTRCIQKSVYHRMIAFDPSAYKFPFSIESFMLPASCACFQEGYLG